MKKHLIAAAVAAAVAVPAAGQNVEIYGILWSAHGSGKTTLINAVLANDAGSDFRGIPRSHI